MKISRSGVLLLLLAASGCSGATQSSSALNTLSPAERAQGWTLLFDGQTMNGWTNRGMAEWHVEDGALTPTPGTGQGHLATNQSYGDFRLVLEFWGEETANSGVYFRTPENDPANVDNSWEVQIFDNGPQWQTGAIVNLTPVSVRVPTAGKWNTMDLTARGNHFTVLINGQQVVDITAPMPRLPRGKIILAPAGQSRIRFRNIRLLPL